jgi:beta-lactamase class A
MHFFTRLLLIGGILLLVVAGGLTVLRDRAQAVVQQNPAAKTATVNAVMFDANDLTKELAAIAASYSSLDISVAVTDLNNNQSFSYGDSAAFVGASTTKTLVAAMYLHEVEEGAQSLNQMYGNSSAANLITAMIEQSDNDAWVTLRSALGSNNLQDYAQSLGMTSFNATDNTITASDMALLLQKLYSGSLLNASNTSLLLGHMQKSIRNYLSPALGSGYTVYHKAGWLEDRLMDTAIVSDGTHSYILVIFSKANTGIYDFSAGSALFSSITIAVNNALTAN